MRAITIQQPWASLIACGAKKYETRKWKTPYRGKIAIHAGKNLFDELDRYVVDAMRRKLFPEHSIYDDFFLRCQKELPFGAIIATADLVECWHIEEHWTPGENGRDLYLVNSRGEKKSWAQNCVKEMFFGDFSKGRYAWELANVKMLDKPVPAKGKQGLWDWESGVDGE